MTSLHTMQKKRSKAVYSEHVTTTTPEMTKDYVTGVRVRRKTKVHVIDLPRPTAFGRNHVIYLINKSHLLISYLSDQYLINKSHLLISYLSDQYLILSFLKILSDNSSMPKIEMSNFTVNPNPK
jgi:hypothetical protein